MENNTNPLAEYPFFAEFRKNNPSLFENVVEDIKSGKIVVTEQDRIDLSKYKLRAYLCAYDTIDEIPDALLKGLYFG